MNIIAPTRFTETTSHIAAILAQFLEGCDPEFDAMPVDDALYERLLKRYRGFEYADDPRFADLDGDAVNESFIAASGSSSIITTDLKGITS